MPGYLCITIATVLFASSLGAFILQWRARGKDQLPRCASCGYVVTGLPSFICPECGGDLNTVGITHTPSQHRRRLVQIVMWSAVLPLPALVVSAITPTKYFSSKSVPSPDVLLSPASGGFAILAQSTVEAGRHSGYVPLLILTLTESSSGARVQLEIERDSLVCHRTRKGPPMHTQNEGAIDAEILFGWARDAGLTVHSQEMRDELTELIGFVQRWGKGATVNNAAELLTHYESAPMTWQSRPTFAPNAAGLAEIVIWLSVWAIGVYRIARTRPVSRDVNVCETDIPSSANAES